MERNRGPTGPRCNSVMKAVARKTVTYHLDGRLHEWTMAVSMALCGLAILMFPRMVHGSIMGILAVFLNSFVIGTIFLSLGLLRMAALIANGQSMQVGPRLRSIVAAITSVLWTTFTLSMVRVSFDQGFPSPMVFFWGPFTAAEIYISYRAVLDVRTRS